jgi:acylphosphatase
MKRLTASVYGRVQGVYFRHYTSLEANRLGLTGWVHNEADGSVGVVAEGPEDSLRRLLDFLRLGPSSATVERVEVVWSEAGGDFTAFAVR